jgi:hypothetical protein
MLKKFFTIFGVSVLLLSCEYDHQKTMQSLIWNSIEYNNQSFSNRVSTVPIQILSSYEVLEIYNEKISEVEFEFLRNNALFDLLESGASFWNKSFSIGQEENLKQSYQQFSAAIKLIEVFLSDHNHQPFEDISYVYYVYAGTLHSAKDCYIRYEAYKYHLPFISNHEKNLIEQKLNETWFIIKQNNTQMAQFLAATETEKY